MAENTHRGTCCLASREVRGKLHDDRDWVIVFSKHPVETQWRIRRAGKAVPAGCSESLSVCCYFVRESSWQSTFSFRVTSILIHLNELALLFLLTHLSHMPNCGLTCKVFSWKLDRKSIIGPASDKSLLNGYHSLSLVLIFIITSIKLHLPWPGKNSILVRTDAQNEFSVLQAIIKRRSWSKGKNKVYWVSICIAFIMQIMLDNNSL